MRREDGRSVETTLRCAHARNAPHGVRYRPGVWSREFGEDQYVLGQQPIGEAYVRRSLVAMGTDYLKGGSE